MSSTQHVAGGLEGLALGAPIGGGSHSTGPTNTKPAGTGLVSAHPGSSAPHYDNQGDAHRTNVGAKLDSAAHGNQSSTTHYDNQGDAHRSGLAAKVDSAVHGSGNNNYGTSTSSGAPHYDNQGDSHRTAVGANVDSALHRGGNKDYDSNAYNSTSGDRGIGGGRGGPTAFESDASRVGVNSGSHHTGSGSGIGSGLSSKYDTDSSNYNSSNRDRDFNQAGLTALSGPGHHDQSRIGQYDSGPATTHSHTGAGVGAGLAGVGAGVGAAGLAGSHRGHGSVDDSVTGQTHFKDSAINAVPVGSIGSQGVGHGTSSTSTTGQYGHGGALATGAGIGAAGAGASSLGSKTHGDNHGTGPGSELKKELKKHQGSGSNSSASHHVETDGPHGLVWHNGKYVHARELDGHGSTGVPLK